MVAPVAHLGGRYATRRQDCNSFRLLLTFEPRPRPAYRIFLCGQRASGEVEQRMDCATVRLTPQARAHLAPVENESLGLPV